jgi:hypothetical protein
MPPSASSVYASHRTGLVWTGVFLAAVTNVIGVAVVFAGFAIESPGLILLLVREPGYFLFLSIFLLIGLTFGAAIGCLGGVLGRLIPAPRSPARD